MNIIQVLLYLENPRKNLTLMQQAKLWKYTFKASRTQCDCKQLWKIKIQKFRNSQWGRHIQTHIQVPRSCSICWMMQKLPISIISSVALHKLIPLSHTSSTLRLMPHQSPFLSISYGHTSVNISRSSVFLGKKHSFALREKTIAMLLLVTLGVVMLLLSCWLIDNTH